jgi:hypothetical protein
MKKFIIFLSPQHIYGPSPFALWTASMNQASSSAASSSSSSAKRAAASAELRDKQDVKKAGAVNDISATDAKHLWSRVLAEKRESPDGCWLHTNKPNPKGYVQVAKDATTKVYVHHLAVRMVRGAAAVPTSRSVHVSHLCHVHGCFNPDHLVIETVEQNKSRNYCLVTVQCAYGTQAAACSHSPRCMRRHPKVQVPVQPQQQ